MYEQAQQGYGSSGLTSYLSEPETRTQGNEYNKVIPIDFSKHYKGPEHKTDPSMYLENKIATGNTLSTLSGEYFGQQGGNNPLESILGGAYQINITINYGPVTNNVYASQNKSYESPSAVIQDSIIETIKNTYLNSPKVDFVADSFLTNHRPITQFIGETKEVKNFVEQAFKEVTGEEWPENLVLHVLNEEEFLKAHGQHGGFFSEGILGFSLNTQGRGINEVFVKQDNLDRMMLTIGHEIGHVMSLSLPNMQDEEAKAFAFSIAWMEKIVKKNIAGLSTCIHPRPAENGLHNVAFNFVSKLLNRGTNAFELFKDLVKGNKTIMIGG